MIAIPLGSNPSAIYYFNPPLIASAIQIESTKDKAVPVQTGSHAVYVKNRVHIRAVIGIPTAACLGAAIATMRIKAKMKMNDIIIPACEAVTFSEGAIDVNQSSQTKVNR